MSGQKFEQSLTCHKPNPTVITSRVPTQCPFSIQWYNLALLTNALASNFWAGTCEEESHHGPCLWDYWSWSMVVSSRKTCRSSLEKSRYFLLVSGRHSFSSFSCHTWWIWVSWEPVLANTARDMVKRSLFQAIFLNFSYDKPIQNKFIIPIYVFEFFFLLLVKESGLQIPICYLSRAQL